jgi:tripartite-type tricarboxylate transporter receptor subunit TctC
MACADFAMAQSWPDRTVHFVVGLPPGSGMDVATRILAKRLRDEFNQPMVVETRTGADGAIAARAVANAAPDGYTLLPSTGSQMAANPVLQSNIPYDSLKDFEPIGLFARFHLVLVVHPGVPAASVRELVAYAKAHPEAINYGSGSSNLMLKTESLRKATGMPMRAIPYNGVPPTVAGLLAGDVQMAIVNLTPAVGHIKAGKLRALAVLGPTRDPLLPDVPTIAEAGVKGYDASLWVGMFAPAGTPKDVIARLSAAIARAIESAEVRESMRAAGIVPSISSPQALDDLVRREIRQNRAVASEAGLLPNP